MGQSEGDPVILSGLIQGSHLLIRPRERGQILEKPSLIVLLFRNAENELDLILGDRPMHIEIGHLRPIRKSPLPLFLRVNDHLLHLRVIHCVINFFCHRHIRIPPSR